MAGTSQAILCRGFSDTEGFEQSKEALKLVHGLTDREIDDRLRALTWGLARGGDPALVQRVPGRNLWVAVTPGGIPPLRVYFRPVLTCQPNATYFGSRRNRRTARETQSPSAGLLSGFVSLTDARGRVIDI